MSELDSQISKGGAERAKFTLKEIQAMTDNELKIACRAAQGNSCENNRMSLCYCCAVGIELEKRRKQAKGGE